MIRKLHTYISREKNAILKMRKFNKDFNKFRSLNENNRLSVLDSDLFPCLEDSTQITSFDSHYIYHPAWAARVIRKINPTKHVDISSSLHFSSIISAFVKTEFYDYRPANLDLPNLFCSKADLNSLFFETNSIQSLSCMHTVEHVGLGRYGDPLDPNGDIKAINELKRVTAIGGALIFVVPVGRPRLQFNAHRIYSFEMIQDLFSDFSLEEFTLINDRGEYIENCDPELIKYQSYGCGCFWFKKQR